MIMDCHIMFSDPMIQEIDKIVKSEQQELIDILESNNIKIENESVKHLNEFKSFKFFPA